MNDHKDISYGLCACMCVCVCVNPAFKQTDSDGMPALYFKDPGLEFKPVTTRVGGGDLKVFLSKHLCYKYI